MSPINIKTLTSPFLKVVGLLMALMILYVSCGSDDYIVEEKQSFVYRLYEGVQFEELVDVDEHISLNLPRMLYDLSLDEIDEPITIHVWKTNEEFLNQQKRKIGKKYPGSTGYVFKKKNIAVRLTNRTKETVEHELAHVLSYRLNSNIGNNPRWLWETIAIFESE